MRALPLALAILVVASSSASASWMAVGGREPSTSYDRVGFRMFEHPDTNASRPPGIYFQAFQSPEGLTLNPNVAVVGSDILAPGAVRHRALLGVWRDCNGDGYVGHAESALQDYPTVLLPNTTICPFGEFNDGQWVSEMIGIGMVDPCEYKSADHRALACGGMSEFHENERVFYANGTMVWGDLGAPGGVPPEECPMAPLPPGTTSGTGAMLAHTDCQAGHRVARAVNDLDPDGALGLRFEDPEHPESSSSTLNVVFPVSLFGGPRGPGLLQSGSGGKAATVWDCEAPRDAELRDPTGGALSSLVVTDPSGDRLTGPQQALPVVGRVTIFEDHDGNGATPGQRAIPVTENGAIVWLPHADPVVHDPTGSWWDTAEEVADGPRGGDCDPSTTSPARAASPGALIEGGEARVDEAKKDRASLSFVFYDGHRGINGNIDFVFGPTAPSDLGLLFLRHGRGGAGPLWSADAITTQEPQLVTRGSLDATGPIHWTYYAKLGPDVLTSAYRRPAGHADFAYGVEACSQDQHDENGWVCDGARWWQDALGRDMRPRYVEGTVPYGPLPFERYHLRDVDCYDGRLVGGIGLYASLVTVNSTSC